MAKITKNVDGINQGISCNLQAINGITEIGGKLSGITDFPRIGASKISSALNNCISSIKAVQNQLASFGSSIQNAAIELDRADQVNQNEANDLFNAYTQTNHSKDGINLFAFFEDYDKQKNDTLSTLLSQDMTKEDMEKAMIEIGISKENIENYNFEPSKEDKNNTTSVVKSIWALANLYSGDPTAFAMMSNDEKITTTVVDGTIKKGLWNIGEAIVDSVITIGGKVVTGIQDLFDSTNTTQTKEWIMDTVSFKAVDSAYTGFYTNTDLGKAINQNSSIKYDSHTANTITSLTETGGQIGLSYLNPVVGALLAGLRGTGEKAETEYSKADRDYEMGTTKSMLNGVWEGGQWYLGAKIGSTLNATNAFQVHGKIWENLYTFFYDQSNLTKTAFSTVTEAVTSGIDPMVKTTIDNIGDDRTWNDIFTEDYGGVNSVITNMLIAAGIDVGFDIGINSKNLFSVFNATGAKVSDKYYSIANNIIAKQYDIKISDPQARTAIADDIRYNRKNKISKEYVKNFYSSIDQALLLNHYRNKNFLKTTLNKNIPIKESLNDIEYNFNNNYPKIQSNLDKIDNFLKSNYIFGIHNPTNINDQLILSTDAYRNLEYIKSDPKALAFSHSSNNTVLNVFQPNHLDPSIIIHENIHYTGTNNSGIGLMIQEKYRGVNEGITDYITNCVEIHDTGNNVPLPNSGYLPITEVYSTMSNIMDQFYNANYMLSPKGIRGLTQYHYSNDISSLEFMFKRIGGTDKMWDDFVDSSQIIATSYDLNKRQNAESTLKQIIDDLNINSSIKLANLLQQ